MNTNKIIIYITIIFVVLLISVPTIYKVINDNHEKLYLVTEKLIKESAERCVYEGVCKSSKVTLKELYEYRYIKDQLMDPVTKAIYKDSSYVELTKKETNFYPEY